MENVFVTTNATTQCLFNKIKIQIKKVAARTTFLDGLLLYYLDRAGSTPGPLFFLASILDLTSSVNFPGAFTTAFVIAFID